MKNDGGVQDDPSFRISVATGITIGLLASFIQSLGLTMQRKSHVQNEKVPYSLRLSDWQRPLWVTGFVTYFTSNICGSIFQIGALPLVILGPLGAVSLLWNAILARLLLGDVFSIYLVVGSVLIATGAVLIGCFGVVHESTHPLKELIQLYFRPIFVIVFITMCVLVGIVCVIAHFTEWELERMIQGGIQTRAYVKAGVDIGHGHHQQQQQAGEVTLGNLQHHQDKAGQVDRSDGTFSMSLQRRRSLGQRVKSSSAVEPDKAVLSPNGHSLTLPPILTFGHQHDELTNKSGSVTNKGTPASLEKAKEHTPPQRSIARTRLFLGVAYGSASGTLSGICLLFAKTGVELLILTIVGVENEFLQWQTWIIVLALVIAAVLQLWYLNKALRLVGPTLICPLAFCFYNLSGMINGLVYYDQVRLLSWTQIGLVILGTSVLLAGVWLVSIQSGQTLEEDSDGEPELEATPLLESAVPLPCMPATERTALLENDRRAASRGVQFSHAGTEAQMQLEWHGDVGERRKEACKRTLRSVYHMLVTEPLRGFSVGLGAASPGFAIRPARRRPGLATRMMSLSFSTDDDGDDEMGSPQSSVDLTSAMRPGGRPRLSLHGRGMSETGTASQPRVVSPRRTRPLSALTGRTGPTGNMPRDAIVDSDKAEQGRDAWHGSLVPIPDGDGLERDSAGGDRGPAAGGGGRTRWGRWLRGVAEGKARRG